MINEKKDTLRAHDSDNGFKLNYKRTCFIGFAFFGILLLWQVYDSWCPKFLTELFKEALHTNNTEDVQYLVGIMMALDNLAALIMLPIFGHLSDKTHTKIGKRMPYILVGTFLCAITFPFVPVAFHFHSIAGTIVTMAFVIFFAMMYRNPAVALMPDITPKPLRSRANGIINIMGYIGGACATVLGIGFNLSKNYLPGWADGTANIWVIEAPFLIGSLLMVISALVLFFKIKENEVGAEMKEEMERGEAYAEVAEKVTEDDTKPMSKANKAMLWMILGAEFLWFMADNGINTFMAVYTTDYLLCQHSSSMVNIIVGGVGSVLGFAIGGIIASKIGRKWSVFTGLSLTFTGLLLWLILGLSIPVKQVDINAGVFNTFPFYLYIVWFIKGFGMSLVHVNSFPMVVELCSSSKIGKFTGYYYAASMAAQTITPIALGSLLLLPNFSFKLLPLYALVLIGSAAIVFFFIKNVKNNKTSNRFGLDAFGDND